MRKILFLIFIFALLSACTYSGTDLSSHTLGEAYEVTYVFDGDTIEVDMHGQREKVRLIGIDAPETDGPYTEAECYGEEAKHYATYLLSETHVHLMADPSQDDRDSYGRLLRYAFTMQSENVGSILLRLGYVKEFTFIKDYKFKNSFLAAQNEAKSKEIGVWSPDLCPK